jgi:hypothetical protein
MADVLKAELHCTRNLLVDTAWVASSLILFMLDASQFYVPDSAGTESNPAVFVTSWIDFILNAVLPRSGSFCSLSYVCCLLQQDRSHVLKVSVLKNW